MGSSIREDATFLFLGARIVKDIIAVDTEGTGLNPWIGDRAFGISICDIEGKAEWFEFPVDAATRQVQYGGKDYDKIKALLEDQTIDKVFFNAPYDLRMLEFAGIYVAGGIEEASLAVRICGVDRIYWKLKPLCKQYFDISDEDEDTLKKYVRTLRGRAKLLGYNLGEVVEQDYWLIQYASNIMLGGLHELQTYQKAGEAKRNELDHIARVHAKMMREATKEYATLDAIRTITTWLFFQEQMIDKNLYHIYEEENELLLNVTYEMVTRGIQTNRANVKHGLQRARAQQARARFKMNSVFWNGFNPNSVNDKRRYFIDYKRLQPLTFSKKTLEPSIDQNFLEYYAKKEPGAKAIVDYVAAVKAKSTYFEWMLENSDGSFVIHPDLNQYGTLTGRYSGRLLTIPKRAKEGSIMLDVRRCFVPREGCYWLLADYSQIEARIYADEFEEATMIEAFENGEDVYTALEQTILSNTGIDVGRQVAKNIFLGKIYGLGLDHMIEMIMEESHVDVDSDGAKAIVEAFDSTFPIVNKSMKEVAQRVERLGFIRNRYKQTINVPYDFAYKGVNYIIQSTAQRFIKRAMLRLQELNIPLVLQVHDELIFEVAEHLSAKKVARSIKPIMEDDEELFPHVQLKVDFEIAKTSWLEKEELCLH